MDWSTPECRSPAAKVNLFCSGGKVAIQAVSWNRDRRLEIHHSQEFLDTGFRRYDDTQDWLIGILA